MRWLLHQGSWLIPILSWVICVAIFQLSDPLLHRNEELIWVGCILNIHFAHIVQISCDQICTIVNIDSLWNVHVKLFQQIGRR